MSSCPARAYPRTPLSAVGLTSSVPNSAAVLWRMAASSSARCPPSMPLPAMSSLPALRKSVLPISVISSGALAICCPTTSLCSPTCCPTPPPVWSSTPTWLQVSVPNPCTTSRSMSAATSPPSKSATRTRATGCAVRSPTVSANYIIYIRNASRTPIPPTRLWMKWTVSCRATSNRMTTDLMLVSTTLSILSSRRLTLSRRLSPNGSAHGRWWRISAIATIFPLCGSTSPSTR